MDVTSSRLSRRSALKVLGGAAGAAAVSACAPATSGAPAGGAAAGKPRSGGSIKVYAPEPVTRDPHLINKDYWQSINQAYDTLIAYDKTLKPQPLLAESWDVASDLKQVKLNLRKGVQFHTGREMTSDDIKYNLLRVRDPKRTTTQLGAWSNWFSSIETPDKYTIVLKSTASRPAMFDLFEYMAILEPEAQDAIDAKTGKLNLVGTGPFKVQEWLPGQSITLTKNASYWRTGKPYLDQIQVIFGTDLQAAVTQLEAGAIDDLPDPLIRDAQRLGSNPKFRVTRNELSGMHFIAIANTTLSPTDNKRFRQAINYTLDRKRISETLLLGQVGKPTSLPWTASSPAYDASKASFYSYDLDKAKALLAGISVPELEIALSPTTLQINGAAEILQADLQKIGVKTTIKNMERAAFTPYTRGLQYKGIMLAAGGFAQVSPSALFASVSYSDVAGANTHGIKDPEYSRLIAGLGSEADPAKQKVLYSQVNDYILDQSVQMPLTFNQPVRLSKAALKGQSWRISEVPMLEEWYLDQ